METPVLENPAAEAASGFTLSAGCIVGIVATVIALIVSLIVYRKYDEEGLTNISAVCVVVAIAGAVVAVIAMLFFHVPFSKIASAGNMVLLVLMPFISVSLIFFCGNEVLDKMEYKDKYGLKLPRSFCRSFLLYSLVVGFFNSILILLVALIAILFFKVEGKQAGSAIGDRLVWILGVNIVLSVVCIVLDLIRKGIYKFKVYKIERREVMAHKEFDIIMFEIVDKEGITDEDTVKECCQKRGSGKYQDLLETEHFIRDGLQNLVNNGKIEKKTTHGTVEALYYTKNPIKREEVREVFEL